jgi:hypothetical protein
MDKNSIGAPQGASAAWGDGSNDTSSDIAFDDPEADFGPVPPVVSEPESDSTPMRAKVETAKPADDLTIPDFLDRRAEFKPGTLLTEDDEAFLESGGFK